MKKVITSLLFVVASVLFLSTVSAANVLFDAAIRSVDKKFTYYDKEVKKAKFGNKQWEKRVDSKKISIEKTLKKIEKKWPKEDVSPYWGKLDQRVKFFQSKQSSSAPETINTQKVVNKKIKAVKKDKKTALKPTKRVDRLLQLATKSINDKFKDYDTFLAQKKYGKNQWFLQLNNKKKIIVTALNNLKNKWPNENIKTYWDGLKSRDDNLSKNTYQFIDKAVKQRFSLFDKHLKKGQYGQKKWDEHLKTLGTNLNNAIKYLAKKWPSEAKVYTSHFQKRIAIINSKTKALASVAKSKINKKNKAKATQLAKSKVKKTKPKVSVPLLAKVKKDQAKYEANNKIEIWDNSTGDLKRSEGGLASLSFSSDYAQGNKSKTSFNGQDFIYAHLNLPDHLTNLLPKEFAKGLQYYKVTIKATVKGESLYVTDKTQKNAKRLSKKADFVLAYDTNNLAIAVVPEKAFFENVLDKYRSGEKFEDTATEEKALRDLLSRNFSRQMSNLFKKLSVGEHQVEMEFQVLAKLHSSKYFELKNMKGTFLLTVDNESKQKYKNTFDMLTKLYRTYESQHNIAVGGLNLDAEKKRIANMSPRERERYKIAKISSTGYMAAYGGERAKIKFSFGKLREKNAYIDIVWNKGSCAKCEEGATSVVVRKTAAKTFNIPLGARVTLNGRTLINKVDSKKHVPLYWHF